MFKIHSEIGLFQINFGGITLYAGLGSTHLCEARYKTCVNGCFESANVEVALLDSESVAWITREIWEEVFGDNLNDVAGCVTPRQFAQLVSYLNERNQNES